MITWVSRPPRAKRPHDWGHMARLPYAMCGRCGLLWLKNDASDRAARAKYTGHGESD